MTNERQEASYGHALKGFEDDLIIIDVVGGSDLRPNTCCYGPRPLECNGFWRQAPTDDMRFQEGCQQVASQLSWERVVEHMEGM